MGKNHFQPEIETSNGSKHKDQAFIHMWKISQNTKKKSEDD